MPPEIQSFVDTAFYAVVTGGIGFTIRFLGKLSNSISQLNMQIGVVIENISDHDYRLQRLEKNQDKNCEE